MDGIITAMNQFEFPPTLEICVLEELPLAFHYFPPRLCPQLTTLKLAWPGSMSFDPELYGHICGALVGFLAANAENKVMQSLTLSLPHLSLIGLTVLPYNLTRLDLSDCHLSDELQVLGILPARLHDLELPVNFDSLPLFFPSNVTLLELIYDSVPAHTINEPLPPIHELQQLRRLQIDDSYLPPDLSTITLWLPDIAIGLEYLQIDTESLPIRQLKKALPRLHRLRELSLRGRINSGFLSALPRSLTDLHLRSFSHPGLTVADLSTPTDWWHTSFPPSLTKLRLTLSCRCSPTLPRPSNLTALSTYYID